ncbi:MAG: hypothetical protein RR683_06735, partial [Lachnospiraceae bacterium]
TFSKVTTKMMESLGVNTEQKVTFMHYLMIGLHEESLGAISEEDLLFSVNIPTVEKRKEQNLKVVKERLHNYSFSIKPIRMVLNIGIIIFVASIVVLLYSLIAKLTGNTVSGWTSIVGSIWLLGGIQLLSLGIVGEYIGKIYSEVKHRPPYIVDQMLMNKDDDENI